LLSILVTGNLFIMDVTYLRMLNVIHGTCIVCGKGFVGMSKRKCFCSGECKRENMKNRAAQRKRICSMCEEKQTESAHCKYCEECRIIKNTEIRKKINVKRNSKARERYHIMKLDPEWKKKKYESAKKCISRRYRKDKNFATAMRLRSLVYQNLRRYSDGGKVKPSKKYGIDYKKIIKHLEPLPEDIKLYHIDHIIPLSRFNLNNEEEIKSAFAPENHQWLLAKDNLSKGNKLNWIKGKE